MPSPAAVDESNVLVARCDAEFRVLARRPIEPGTVILELRGVLVAQPTRHTLQVERYAHLEAPDPGDLVGSLDQHPWRFLNHSCQPNARVAGRSLLALCRIEAGEEITFDYSTTEYDMSNPFSCRCGAPSCVQIVRGFRHLDATQRRSRWHCLAEHLRTVCGEEECLGRDEPR